MRATEPALSTFQLAPILHPGSLAQPHSDALGQAVHDHKTREVDLLVTRAGKLSKRLKSHVFAGSITRQMSGKRIVVFRLGGVGQNLGLA